VIPIDRDRFAIIQRRLAAPELILESNRVQIHIRQNLTIKSAVLEKSLSKWRFIWMGQNISASIFDENFFHKLASHEYEFGQGDALICDIEIRQELNRIINVYVNKEYRIVLVHDHQKGPKQIPLPD
jgi:hypothetical protein